MREGDFVLSFINALTIPKNKNSDISADFRKFAIAFGNFQ